MKRHFLILTFLLLLMSFFVSAEIPDKNQVFNPKEQLIPLENQYVVTFLSFDINSIDEIVFYYQFSSITHNYYCNSKILFFNKDSIKLNKSIKNYLKSITLNYLYIHSKNKLRIKSPESNNKFRFYTSNTNYCLNSHI